MEKLFSAMWQVPEQSQANMSTELSFVTNCDNLSKVQPHYYYEGVTSASWSSTVVEKRQRVATVWNQWMDSPDYKNGAFILIVTILLK